MISLETAKKLKECECGCGGLFEPIDNKGRMRRYLPGHNARINHGMRGKSAPNAKGGRIGQFGYKMIYIPLDERALHCCKNDGYEYEHRYIMENYLGRKLNKNEAVHHKDGNKLNNAIENLELMTHSQHMSLEARKRPINVKAIEAMRRVNIKTKKAICIMDGCNNAAICRGLCVKHHHWLREGKIEILDGVITIINKHRKEPGIKEKTCRQCGAKYLTTSNRSMYCEKCGTAYQHIKRSRQRRKQNYVIS